MKNWKLMAAIFVGAFTSIGALYVTFVPKAEFVALAEDYQNHKLLQYKRDLQSQVWALQDRLIAKPGDKDLQRELRALEEELREVKCQLYPKTCETGQE